MAGRRSSIFGLWAAPGAPETRPKGPRGPFKGPRGPFKGPRCPFKESFGRVEFSPGLHSPKGMPARSGSKDDGLWGGCFEQPSVQDEHHNLPNRKTARLHPGSPQLLRDSRTWARALRASSSRHGRRRTSATLELRKLRKAAAWHGHLCFYCVCCFLFRSGGGGGVGEAPAMEMENHRTIRRLNLDPNPRKVNSAGTSSSLCRARALHNRDILDFPGGRGGF